MNIEWAADYIKGLRSKSCSVRQLERNRQKSDFDIKSGLTEHGSSLGALIHSAGCLIILHARFFSTHTQMRHGEQLTVCVVHGLLSPPDKGQ